jgi:FAD-dependent oxidoreductase domain-containing protein 1
MDDVVIVGGGIIGTATAYFLSKEGRKVKVIERDPTYKTASFHYHLVDLEDSFFKKKTYYLESLLENLSFKYQNYLKLKKIQTLQQAWLQMATC